MAGHEYLDLTPRELLERLAGNGPNVGGGSLAALVVTLSAGLVRMVCRRSRESWSDTAGIAAQAKELQVRAEPLARADAEAWESALAALAGAAAGNGDADLERKLALSAEIPVQIAEAAADVAALAALAAEIGEGTYRGDAVAAAILAEAGARVAANLVRINLGTREGDERLLRALQSLEVAKAAAARALDAGP